MAEYFGATVADIFNTMPKRFKPEEAKDVDIVIGYEATGEGGGKWMAHIKHGTLTVSKVEELKGCKTSIHADAETFLGVTLGKITAIDALTSQKLRVVGDARLLMTLLPKIFVPFTVTPKKREISARDILATIESRFRPDKAEGVTMNIGYDLTGEDGGQWTMQIKDGQCKVREGFAGDLTVKLIMDAGVYAGMMTGTIDGASAFTSGQVRIEGDMMAAAATAKFFHKFVDPQRKGGGRADLPAGHQRHRTAVRLRSRHGKMVCGAPREEVPGKQMPGMRPDADPAARNLCDLPGPRQRIR